MNKNTNVGFCLPEVRFSIKTEQKYGITAIPNLRKQLRRLGIAVDTNYIALY